MLPAIGLLLIERTIFHIVNSKTYYLRRRVQRKYTIYAVG